MGVEGSENYREFLILLAAAGIIVPLFVRLGISTILGFLLVGIVLGRDVLGSLTAIHPIHRELYPHRRQGDRIDSGNSASSSCCS